VTVATLPDEVDVDGLIDALGVKYLGVATRSSGDLYTCLANVDGCLCQVEVRITPAPKRERSG
jgi:hypothetical protein